MKNIIIVAGLLAVLGACEAVELREDLVPEQRFVTEERRLLNLADDLNKLGISPAVSLPTTGSSNYAGKILFSEDDYSLIGDLNIGVNFSTSSINGNARDFVDSNNTEFTGQLVIDDGRLNRSANPVSDYQFSASMDGVLSSATGSALIESNLSGDFLGPNREAMSGIVVGTVRTIEGTGFVGLTTVDGVGIADGEFGAKRQ